MQAFATRQGSYAAGPRPSARPSPPSRHRSTNPLWQNMALRIQRSCACVGSTGLAGECAECARKLTINPTGDRYEREADRVASEVMRPQQGIAQRQVEKEQKAEVVQREPLSARITPLAARAEDSLQSSAAGRAGDGASTASTAVHDALRSPSEPLDHDTRRFMESRLGRGFGRVRIHAGNAAADSAGQIGARAYTIGSNVVFGSRQYAPGTLEGKRLLAHELVHVVQQRGAASHLIQRAETDDGGGGGGGGGGAGCKPPTGCPKEFCVSPFASRADAEKARNSSALFLLGLLGGIAAKVSPRVVPVWTQYLSGGAAPQDFSERFGKDFTDSETTALTTDFLVGELARSIESRPPIFPPGKTETVIDIASRIAPAIKSIGTPDDLQAMNFNFDKEIPGNIAGEIGHDQKRCRVGAKPSPFNDDRTAFGVAAVRRNPDGSLDIFPGLVYIVRDTVDLCPAQCGTKEEQVATIPMSQFEAAGVSGDVPFTVVFPAPPRQVTVRPTGPPPAPVPVTGVVTASSLNIRAQPSTSAPILGQYPKGEVITIECETLGELVEGNLTWDRTDRGFVSDRFVFRITDDQPPPC